MTDLNFKTITALIILIFFFSFGKLTIAGGAIDGTFKSDSKVVVTEDIARTFLSEDKKSEIEFQNYPVNKIYSGKPAKVILTTEQERYFRTRLRETKNMPVNFAGEYVFNSWGCGTGCSFGAAVNHRTGKVVFFPYPNFISVATCVGQYHNEEDEHFEFYEKSRLMKVFGTDEIFGGEDGDKLKIRFYEFTESKFKLTKSIPMNCEKIGSH